MSKQRMVQTSIWRKSRRFRECNPLERYLFLFLITNEDVDLCGVYELSMDDMAHFTGIDHRTLPEMLKRLGEIGLAHYYNGWVIIPRYVETQRQTNPKVRAGIERSLSELPGDVREAMDRLSIDHPKSTSDSDSDSDSDIDSDNDKEIADEASATVPAVSTAIDEKPPPPMRDTLENNIEQAFFKVLGRTYANFAKERKQVKKIATLCRRRAPDDPWAYAHRMLTAYYRMWKSERWLSATAFLPSMLVNQWDQVERGVDQLTESAEVSSYV